MEADIFSFDLIVASRSVVLIEAALVLIAALFQFVVTFFVTGGPVVVALVKGNKCPLQKFAPKTIYFIHSTP